jgi:hypothetical protein
MRVMRQQPVRDKNRWSFNIKQPTNFHPKRYPVAGRRLTHISERDIYASPRL